MTGFLKAALLALSCLMASTGQAHAQEKLTPERGQTARGGWWVYTGVTTQALGEALDQTKSRIVDLEVAGTSPLRLNATLIGNSGPYGSGWWWYVDQTTETLGKLLQQNNARLTNLTTYSVNGQLRFAATMIPNTGANASGWWWYVNQTSASVSNLLKQNNARLIDLQGYISGNQTLYAVVMVSNTGPKATGWWWYLGQTTDQISQLVNTNKARILRLRQSSGGGGRYDVIMVANSGSDAIGWWWWNTSSDQLPELAGRYGARMIDYTARPGGAIGVMIDNGMVTTGDCGGTMAGVDRATSAFMKRFGIPGASVAIVKGNNLVYACGFGYANLAANQQVTPSSLFRIASISKPVTMAAIGKLVTDGKLKSSDLMVDRLGSAKPGGTWKDNRLGQITIQQLLDHTSGWDNDSLKFDPMNASNKVADALGTGKPSTCRDNITYVFQNHSLAWAPGAKYSYSNFGFCILGRIVEAASGQTYETYVQQNILAPIGITRMRIGQSLNSVSNEVRYYDLPLADKVDSIFPPFGKVPRPYGSIHVETGDSAGGWIASASDIVRLLRFGSNVPNEYNGGLAGTATRMVRSGDVYIAILFNGHFDQPKGTADYFNELTNTMIASVSTWPTTDLWAKYGYR